MLRFILILLFLNFNLIVKVNAGEIPLAKINCQKEKTEILHNKTQTVKKSTIQTKVKQIKKQKKYLKSLAKKNKISKKTIKLIDTLQFNPTVARLEKHQPERTITFKEYFEKVMPKYKINDAKQYLKDNWESLDFIEKKYKIEKEAIVSLILIESYLGKILGRFNVMDSLFTLSITGRRTQFWTQELLNVLFLIDKGDNIYSRDLQGSWAGAIGMIQFIPSSFISYAVDSNQDGTRNIVSNKLDAFASAANYLKKSGWKYGAPYLRETQTPKTLKEICKLAGFPFEDGTLVIPDKKLDTQSFIVYNNFETILLWNKSLFFSTTVGIVFNELKNEAQQI